MHYSNNYSNISLQQISIFLETAKYESVSRAAEQLHITHSAVSKSIKNMEYVLELILFYREKQRMRLTPAGKALAEDLTKAMQSIDQALLRANYAQQVKEMPFRIGIPAGVNPDGYLSETLSFYKEQHPDFKYFIETFPYYQLSSLLLSGQLDVVFSFTLDIECYQNEELHTAKILNCPCIAYVHKKCHLSGSQSIEFSELKQMEFLFPSPHFHNTYGNAILQLCKKHNFFPNISYFLYSTENWCLNIQHPRDVLMVDHFAINQNPDAVPVRIENEIAGVILSYRRNADIQAKDFADAAIEYWNSQMNRFFEE